MTNSRPTASRYVKGLLVAGFLFLVACASSPPPPSQPATPIPVVAPDPVPRAEGETPAQAAPTEAAPPAAEPECQAAEDCKKLREPASGLQWTCENTHCLEQAIAEAPKAEVAAEPAKDDKSSKKAKAKGKKK